MGEKVKREITIRLPHKEARKLLAALEKGVYSKLTKAECARLEDFIFNLRCDVMQED
jgi:hypothetical protein